jgi:hypothetical protein
VGTSDIAEHALRLLCGPELEGRKVVELHGPRC